MYIQDRQTDMSDLRQTDTHQLHAGMMAAAAGVAQLQQRRPRFRWHAADARVAARVAWPGRLRHVVRGRALAAAGSRNRASRSRSFRCALSRSPKGRTVDLELYMIRHGEAEQSCECANHRHGCMSVTGDATGWFESWSKKSSCAVSEIARTKAAILSVVVCR